MRLRRKFRLFFVGVLMGFIAGLALSDGAIPVSLASPAQAAFTFEHTAPDHAPACFERHRQCEPAAIASAPLPSAGSAAKPAAALTLPVVVSPLPRGMAPHPPASLTILFRNFRE
jgi:hypothetical protein